MGTVNIMMRWKFPDCHEVILLVFCMPALDAFGKPGAGLFEGNSVWLGNYDECTALEGSKYCLADMVINSTMLGIKVRCRNLTCTCKHFEAGCK